MSKIIVDTIESTGTTVTVNDGLASGAINAGTNAITAGSVTGLTATSLTSGTLAAARLPATGVSAASLTTGDLPTARLDQNVRISAWAVWNQTGTQAITDSFNISSIADGGVGVSNLTFSTAMPNANYVTTQNNNYSISGWEGTCTTTAFGWVSHVGGGYYDYSKCSAVVVGGS